MPEKRIVLTALLLSSCAAPPPAHRARLAEWRELRASRESAPAELPEEELENGDLDTLLRYARRHNPALSSAFQRWKSALERVPEVTALPEPRLTLAAYLSSVETRVGPMHGRVGLAQPFPWFGKLDLAGDVAFETSEAEREGLEAARLDVDQAVRDAWFEWAWLEQAVRITQGHQELLTHWESVARARMETGLGRHADVIRAQVELGKLEDRLRTLADLRRPITARLNAALGRPAGAPLPVPTYPLPQPAELDQEGLAALLHATNPELRALDHRIQAAESDVDLARKSYWPDFQVGLDYTLVGEADAPGVPGSGDDALALSLGLELPVWRAKYAARVRGAEARLRAARLQQEDTHNRLSAELEMALYQFRDADRRVDLFADSLIPKGEESVEALDTAYQAGDEGFLDLIDAERVLLEFQLQAARAEADRAQALARTEQITGVELNPED